VTKPENLIDDLTPLQTKALCLLAAGHTSKATAEATGTHIRSIDGWRNEPKFKQRLKQAVSDIYDMAIAEMALGCAEAARELKHIINDPDIPARTKVSAISVLFANVEKAKTAILEERLENIENQLNDTIEIEAREA
jgi:uncharacterized protein (UPF0147 family)